MPYKDKNKQLEYQRNWIQKRKKEFFQDKICEKCGSTKKLILHHKNPKNKKSHSIWSWSKKKRDNEIKKCIILCENCHIEHHRQQVIKFTDEDTLYIRAQLQKYKRGMIFKLARKYKVHYKTIQDIRDKKTYKHL